MRIVLATGIYPPEVGGPATYVENIARELSERGHDVTVVTYEGTRTSRVGIGTSGWKIIWVSMAGGPLLRWRRYAEALREQGRNADIVEAFSSVSVGVPLWMARLKKPKKILRLGGDFLWERYTDRGGTKRLREWCERSMWIMRKLLGTFDHIIFSTKFQEELYEKQYANMPHHSVIENAVPTGRPTVHAKHEPFRLLFMGRFVGFKNLFALIDAMNLLPEVTLTFVGEGPFLGKLETRNQELATRVQFLPTVHGEEKQRIFAEHDLLVLPSLTEISPHVALEARAAGLPVLLTEETGLSSTLREGMVIRPLRTPDEIAAAARDVMADYDSIARAAASPAPGRSWGNVAEEHLTLFHRLS